jgi:hypothetical protein
MVKKSQYIDIEIDKLTNSLENVITGDSFPTDIVMTDINDFKSITKKEGWLFDWKAEFKKPDRDVYKLTIVNNQTVIQGLISLSVNIDHVYMHLIESAPFNKGKDKVYVGVPGNLVAFACKLSFQRGFQGYLSFLSKTNLINHYERTLGAAHVGGNLMIINTISALRLINKYFEK